MQNNTPPTAQQHDSDEIDLLALLGALIDGKWIIVGFTVCFAVIGVAYALLATPIYQANALIQIEDKSGGSLSALSDISGALGTSSKAVTEIELLKSRSVVGQAVKNLKLDISVSPKYFPVIGEWASRRFRPSSDSPLGEPWFGFDSYNWGGETLDVFQLEVPSNFLARPLTLVAGENKTFALYDSNGDLLLEGKEGEQVNQAGFRIQIQEITANPSAEFTLTKRRELNTILSYQDQLIAMEKGRESGILALSLQSPDPAHASAVLDEVTELYVRQNVERNSAEAAQSLEFLKAQLPQVRKELERYEQALNDYQTSSKSVDISIETQAILDQIVDLDTMMSEQNLKRAEMERRFTRQHPSYQALLEQMEQLKSQKSELTSKVEALPETQQELLRLTRDVQVTTEVYTSLLNRSQELDVVRAGTVGNVRIIDSADVNIIKPVKPQKSLIVAIATVLGGILGVAMVLLRHALNRGLETPDAIEQLGLPVYASIPFSKDQEAVESVAKGKSKSGNGHGSLLLAVSNPADLAIESLRSLRTSLHFARLESKNNILMISGPSPGVGKSFVSANLAAIMAQAGQRVLLIDADMRKGYIHKMFRQAPENGLSELLTTHITSADAIYKTELSTLDFIPRGQIPPNPSELLMHANFSSFLDNVKDEYDIVIIDTPPVLAVTDASIVGRLVGMSLIVTRFGLNSAKEIEVTKRRFEQNDIHLKGAIFNAVEKKASSYGAYGYGNYGYYNYEYKSDKS